MPMKLSMWSSFFVEHSPEDMVAELAGLGWRYSELSDEHSRVLLDRGDPATVGREFRKVAADHGVAFDQGHLYLTLNIAPGDEGERAKAVEVLKPWFDLYNAIGITAGVLHPGGCGDAAVAEAERMKSIDEITRYLDGTDLVICIENCSSGEALKPMLAKTDPARIGVCLDTGHLNLTDECQAEFIRACGPRLQALHLAENAGQHDDHTVPYARGGCVPWPEIAQALSDVHYAGLHNFEVPGENRCPIPVRRLKLPYLKELAKMIFESHELAPGQGG